MNKNRSAFTLIEMLLVIGVIGILASVVIAAINPTKQLNDAHGAKRKASVREIENAISQYIIDGNSFSSLPASKATAKDICRDDIHDTACTGAPSGYDLRALTGTYLVNIPIDPDETDTNITGYRIYQFGSFIKVCSVREESDCGS